MVGDLEQQGEDYHAHAAHDQVLDNTELDEASQIRTKLLLSDNIDLTGVQAVRVRGDGHGAGGVEEGPQQDLHERLVAGGAREGGPQPRQGVVNRRERGEEV